MKPRECEAPGCVKTFIPMRLGQRACGPYCGLKIARAIRKTKEEAEKESLVARKIALKSVKKLKAEAQDAFNQFIRARDKDLPCISCNEENPPMKPGGQWDAGHFKSRGAYPELAFNEDNCHKQCKSCNAGSGKYPAKERTVTAAYEVELVKRIGPERVAALSLPHPVLPLKRHELLAIKATYKAKRKELE